MKESRKILIGFGVVAVICLCALGVSFFALKQMGRKMEKMVNSDPTSIAKTQENIAKFDIPSGYKPVAISFLGYDMISLVPETSTSGMSIMLMQYNGMMTGSPAQVEEQLRQAAEQQNGAPGASMQVVETREETIRDQTVTVTVSEGDFQGFIMRQWTTVFQGNKGPTILIAQGPADQWDEQLLEDFVKSIQ